MKNSNLKFDHKELKAARIKAKLTVEELAQKVGIEPTLIQQYECGKQIPTKEILYRITQALTVDIEDVLMPQLNHQKLKKARVEAKLTVEELAKKLNDAGLDASLTDEKLAKEIEVTPALIQSYERGDRTPDVNTFKKILKGLTINAEDILKTEQLSQKLDHVKLKNARIKADLTVDKLAELVGVSEASIRKYERGERKPKDIVFEKILKELGIKAADITIPEPPPTSLIAQNQINHVKEDFILSYNFSQNLHFDNDIDSLFKYYGANNMFKNPETNKHDIEALFEDFWGNGKFKVPKTKKIDPAALYEYFLDCVQEECHLYWNDFKKRMHGTPKKDQKETATYTYIRKNSLQESDFVYIQEIIMALKKYGDGEPKDWLALVHKNERIVPYFLEITPKLRIVIQKLKKENGDNGLKYDTKKLNLFASSLEQIFQTCETVTFDELEASLDQSEKEEMIEGIRQVWRFMEPKQQFIVSDVLYYVIRHSLGEKAYRYSLKYCKLPAETRDILWAYIWNKTDTNQRQFYQAKERLLKTYSSQEVDNGMLWEYLLDSLDFNDSAIVLFSEYQNIDQEFWLSFQRFFIYTELEDREVIEPLEKTLDILLAGKYLLDTIK